MSPPRLAPPYYLSRNEGALDAFVAGGGDPGPGAARSGPVVGDFRLRRQGFVRIPGTGPRGGGRRHGRGRELREPEGRPRTRLPGDACRPRSLRRGALHALGPGGSHRVPERGAALREVGRGL